jgi:hypothetical protein
LSSFISELASHEVPGFGAPALPSALGLEALASALTMQGPRRLHIRPAVANLPSSPRQPAGWSSAETWPSLPVQRHPRGPNRVGEEERADGELSGSPDGGQSGTDGHPSGGLSADSTPSGNLIRCWSVRLWLGWCQQIDGLRSGQQTHSG